MTQEGAQQVGAALDRARVSAADGGEHVDIGAGKIREWLRLEIAPHVLHGIEFRGVRRERELHGPHDVEERRDGETAVGRRAIPHQRERRLQMPGELLHERQDCRRVEVRLDQQLEVQPHGAAIGTDAQRGDRRDLLPMAPAMPQHGRASALPPRAPDNRQQQETAFVEEDEPGVQSARFF